MASRVGRGLGLLLVALALGVPSAGGRALATTTLSVQVIGGGQATDSGGQISCGAGATSCYATYVTGTTVTLTARDEGMWSFARWSGDCTTSATDPTECSVALDGADHDVTASFTPATAVGTTVLTVNATGDAAGGGNVSGGEIDCDSGDTGCTWDVYPGSTVTLVEDPDDGYDFSGWGGACSGVAVSCTVSMTSATTVNAAFAKSATARTLTVSVAGNGTVTGGGVSCTSAGGSGCTASEDAGSSVTLVATAGAGAGFAGWGGACAGSTTTCTVSMASDRTVTATFSGPGGGAAPATFLLSVSVTGAGSVRGGGIDCGSGGSVCSHDEQAGSTVTLVAEPDSGQSFTGWTGACSGSGATCSVTMSAAKTLTATFSGRAASAATLSVSVSGRGAVAGGGVSCGNGAVTCTAEEAQGSTVELTATPAAGARFSGWGGACSGSAPTCTVTMDGPKSVTAAFGGAASAAAAAGGLLSRGRPVVSRTPSGFAVTLLFRTSRRGVVHVRAFRAGRLEAGLSFTAPAGAARVGPFPLTKRGYYQLELSQAGRTLRWSACLGRCGEAAGRQAGPFRLTRRPPSVNDAGALWAVTLNFRSTRPAGAVVRIYRGRRLTRTVRLALGAGSVHAGAFLLSPGTYRLRLAATDAYGRVRSLSWLAVLP